jgi:hypothetical protein
LPDFTQHSGCWRRFYNPDKGFAKQKPGLAKIRVEAGVEMERSGMT